MLLKQRRHDLVAFPFEHSRLFELQFEYFTQPRNQREITPLTVLAFTRLQPEPARVQIYMVFLSRQGL